MSLPLRIRLRKKRTFMYQHILIPTDGSERSVRAIAAGMALAAALRAKVAALMATPPIPPIVLEGLSPPLRNEELEQNASDYAKKCLDVASEAAAAAGVRCETIHVKHEQPWAAIVETAERKECDLIVMASHGRAGVTAVVLGSETNKVLIHSKIPVLVCR
jgi:nucleotide-binding universal stress UspA family protein